MAKAYASALIKTALAEVGYHEKRTNSQLESKTANSGGNNYTKYANYIDKNCPTFYNARKNGYAWCDLFNDYCYIKTFGETKARELLCQPTKSAGAGCIYSYRYYKAKGQVGKTPKKGAQIFFGKSEGTLHHTGIVIDFDSTYVYTVEGNSNDQVSKRKYARNNSTIYGYGYPKFDAEPKASTVTADFSNVGTSSGADDDTHTAVTTKSVDGDTTKTTSTKSSSSGTKLNTTATRTGTIYNCTAVNVRQYAGSEYPNLKSYPTLKKGVKVGICDTVKDSKGANWYYVLINGKTYGFIHSNYVK